MAFKKPFCTFIDEQTCRSLTPPGIEVLDGRKLDPSDVLGRSHYFRSEEEQLPYQAVMQPVRMLSMMQL